MKWRYHPRLGTIAAAGVEVEVLGCWHCRFEVLYSPVRVASAG
jgi:hypothetical protein